MQDGFGSAARVGSGILGSNVLMFFRHDELKMNSVEFVVQMMLRVNEENAILEGGVSLVQRRRFCMTR